MLKSGASTIPLDRTPPVAKALETDPAPLMRLALEQTVEKIAAVAVLETFGTLTTANERALAEGDSRSPPKHRSQIDGSVETGVASNLRKGPDTALIGENTTSFPFRVRAAGSKAIFVRP